MMLSNDRLELTIQGTGGTLAKLVLRDGESLSPLATMGHFLALDGFGAPSEAERVAGMPFHGEASKQVAKVAAELAGAIRPTVAIMGNGARKGGDPSTWPVLRATPGLEDIWQVHYAAQASTENINPPPDFIANLEPPDEFAMVKLSVRPDRSYTVTNTRNGFTKTYQAGMAGGKKK